MRSTIFRFALFFVTAVTAVLLAASGCGSSADQSGNGGPGGGGSDSGGPTFGSHDGGADSPPGPSNVFMDASFSAPDCPGCTFPGMNAARVRVEHAPPFNVVYPNDGVLVPPNMNVISVQWTPFGAPFTGVRGRLRERRHRHARRHQVRDADDGHRAAAASLGRVRARSSTRACGSSSPNAEPRRRSGHDHRARHDRRHVREHVGEHACTLSFAQEDLLGAIYYWKSTVSANGTGGQIWVKSFGDTNARSRTCTASARRRTCNGCHALSRDGQRMVINSDDDDSDDEYGDVNGSLIDMTTQACPSADGGGRGTT